MDEWFGGGGVVIIILKARGEASPGQRPVQGQKDSAYVCMYVCISKERRKVALCLARLRVVRAYMCVCVCVFLVSRLAAFCLLLCTCICMYMDMLVWLARERERERKRAVSFFSSYSSFILSAPLLHVRGPQTKSETLWSGVNIHIYIHVCVERVFVRVEPQPLAGRSSDCPPLLFFGCLFLFCGWPVNSSRRMRTVLEWAASS